jgi:N-ethylmaleimide reductase
MGPKQAGRAEAEHWLGLGADLISFGRALIANPDLVERLRTGLPITPSTRPRTTRAVTPGT